MVITSTPINKRLRVIRIKGRFFNYSLININALTNDSEEEAKDQFYEQLERAYAACPSHYMKLVMGDANAKFGQETEHQPTIGKHSLHESINENGLKLVDFAAGRQETYYLRCFSMSCWKLSYDEQTYKQPAQFTTKKHNYSHMPMI
jgi:hypothetical protein